MCGSGFLPQLFKKKRKKKSRQERQGGKGGGGDWKGKEGRKEGKGEERERRINLLVVFFFLDNMIIHNRILARISKRR